MASEQATPRPNPRRTAGEYEGCHPRAVLRRLRRRSLAPGAGTPHGAEVTRYEVTVQGRRVTYFARKPPPMPSEPLILVGYAGPADRVRTVRSEAEMRRLYGWR